MAAPLLRISVLSSKELQATILALKGMPAELSKQVRNVLKTFTTYEWQDELKGRVSTRLETRVLSDTARVAVTNQNITLKSATVGKYVGNSLVKPKDIAKAVEFGAPQNTVKTYPSRSRKGRSFTIHNRHTEHQFRGPSRTGYVVYPAAAKLIPRIAAAMVQTTVRALHEAFEGGK